MKNLNCIAMRCSVSAIALGLASGLAAPGVHAKNTEQPASEASGMIASDASAQDQSAQSPSEQGQANDAVAYDGAIVVQARRREENLQDVPISIAAFGGESLADRSVVTTDQLTQLAPNVQFSAVAPSSGNSASSAVFIRGVGQSDFIGSTDPGVGLYIDGVYVARSAGSALSLLDVNRVEILRGPQGTLFGRNTIGGAVQIFSNEPELGDTYGSLTLGVGDFGRFEGRGFVNAPVSDNAALRVAAIYRNRNGYVENITTGVDQANVDTFAARASLLWEPTDNLEVIVRGDYTIDKTDGTATVFGGITNDALFVRLASFFGGCPGMANPGVAVPETAEIDPRCANNAYLDLGPYQTAAQAPSRSRTEVYGGSLNIALDVSDTATLTSTTAYRETRPFSIRDADNTPLKILETINSDVVKQFSQEITLGGELFNDRMTYVIGGYYFRETDDQFYPVYLPSAPNADGVEALVGGSASDAFIKNESLAAFAQGTFDITDQLSLTAGIRYTRDVKEVTPRQVPSPSVEGFENFGYLVPYPAEIDGILYSVCLGAAPDRQTGARGLPCLGSTEFLFDPVLNRRVDSKVTPMASLQYEWSPEVTSYFSFSQGYKSGGFNTRIIQPVFGPNAPTGREALPSFDPETVTSYELGTKFQIGRVFRASVAGYVAKYDDIHIVVREGVAPVVRNAGQATISGFEFEGAISPVPALNIDFGLGYTNFSYDSFTAALEAGQAGLAPGQLGRVDLTDLQAYSPEWSGAIGVSYEIDLGFAFLTPRVDLSHRSRTFFDAPNTPQISQPAYELVNASLTLASNDDRWKLNATVTNLTDEAYRVSGNSSLTASSGYAEVTFAPPRMFTIDATINF